MEWFDKNVKKPITLFSHPVWFIIKDPEKKCTCLDPVSKQADVRCPKCLGTGKRISLARVRAAHQNAQISLRGTGLGFSEIDIVNTYYTYNKTGIRVGDIIIDGPDVDIVKHIYYEHSDQQAIVYWRIETVPMKDPEPIRKSFLAMIKKAGYEE